MKVSSKLNHSGPVRLWIVLMLTWVFAAGWLYSSGVGKKYNVFYFNFMPTPDLSAEQIERLPPLKRYQELAETAESNYFSSSEGMWIYVTQGSLPAWYGRDANCRDVLVRHESNSPMYFRTTCETSWSWLGFLTLLFVPVAVLSAAFAAIVWVVNGFLKKSTSQDER